ATLCTRARRHRPPSDTKGASAPMTNPYAPMLILVALGGGFVIFSVGLAQIIGPKRYNRAKAEAYECGIQPTPQAAEGGRFPIKYYLTAMLFIIFDVEAVFLYPYAVAFEQLGLFTLLAMILFLLNAFFIADAYVWKRGGFEWE